MSSFTTRLLRGGMLRGQPRDGLRRASTSTSYNRSRLHYVQYVVYRMPNTIRSWRQSQTRGGGAVSVLIVCSCIHGTVRCLWESCACPLRTSDQSVPFENVACACGMQHVEAMDHVRS